MKPSQDIPEPPTPPIPSTPPFPVAAPQVEAILLLRESGVLLPLPKGKTDLIIGRSDAARSIYPDIDLAPHGGDAHGVSRRHARLIVEADGVYLEDLNSTNFTFLNRRRLEPGQRYPLRNGDEIRLGLLALEYRET
jgi:pSer/pThr/pTyr-binding forkhead associated (FHA) protein